MIDVNTLTEAYSILKQYIPAKDQQEAADNLISSLVDFLSDDELKEFGTFDFILSRAYKEYTIDNEEYDDSDN